MAHNPTRVCSKPGCPHFKPCPNPEHQPDRVRGTSTQRGYGAGHRRFRAQVLERDPWCKLCGARATVADHHPLSRRDLVAKGLDPDDPARGRGLCKPCHDRETARHQPGGWAAQA